MGGGGCQWGRGLQGSSNKQRRHRGMGCRQGGSRVLQQRAAPELSSNHPALGLRRNPRGDLAGAHPGRLQGQKEGRRQRGRGFLGCVSLRILIPHPGRLHCSHRSLQAPAAWAPCSVAAARSLGAAAEHQSRSPSAGPHPRVQGCGVGSGQNAPGMRRPARAELLQLLP